MRRPPRFLPLPSLIETISFLFIIAVIACVFAIALGWLATTWIDAQ